MVNEVLNLHCDLDLEHNNLIFTQDAPAYENVPSNKIWLQKDQQLIDMVETIISDKLSPHCDFVLDDTKPNVLHDILSYDDGSPYKVYLQKAQQFRRHRPEKHSLTFWTFILTLTTEWK